VGWLRTMCSCQRPDAGRSVKRQLACALFGLRPPGHVRARSHASDTAEAHHSRCAVSGQAFQGKTRRSYRRRDAGGACPRGDSRHIRDLDSCTRRRRGLWPPPRTTSPVDIKEERKHRTVCKKSLMPARPAVLAISTARGCSLERRTNARNVAVEIGSDGAPFEAPQSLTVSRPTVVGAAANRWAANSNPSMSSRLTSSRLTSSPSMSNPSMA
jgi:hypothetical protein